VTLVTDRPEGLASPDNRRFLPAAGGLRGTVRVPGDKSVSHRAALLGAVNDGPLRPGPLGGYAGNAGGRRLRSEIEETGPTRRYGRWELGASPVT
jgi:hypothetical protein